MSILKLISHTKLSNAAIAIRTCYNSFGECKGIYSEPTDNITPEDKELLLKVIKKFKHASTSEHCRFLFKLNKSFNANELFEANSNNFTLVKSLGEGEYLILTNLRVLLENQTKFKLFIKQLPEEFKFLFQ